MRRNYGQPEMIPGLKKQASAFLETNISPAVWINRHTMIAVTAMMLVAESYGLDTAPMEGFDPQAIGREFGLPDNAEVVALLAIGYASEDKPYAGRFALSEIVYDEHFGRSWAGGKSADGSARVLSDLKRRETEKLQPV